MQQNLALQAVFGKQARRSMHLKVWQLGWANREKMAESPIFHQSLVIAAGTCITA
jgi:hypothetical protein